MDGKELVERGLRNGIPLWRIEGELDWQENADPVRQSALLPQVRRPAAMGRALWQPMFLLFGSVFNRAVHLLGLHSCQNHRP
jgi:DNA polymerase III psi subunit